jgi:hypothetical protein
MPMSRYELTLAALSPDAKRLIEDTFNAWSTDSVLGQVARNVAGETALALDEFLSLLTSFTTQIFIGIPPNNCWVSACRSHKLKGRRISIAESPVILGRARSLADHAKSIAKASLGYLSPEEAKRHLIKHSGSTDLINFESFVRASALGNYLVWATFNSAVPDANPFDQLPQSRFGICTALGLGGGMLNETLILLVWNHAECGSPPLHRPTVADAEDYPYYRPCSDAGALWGFTEPLSPNPDGLHPQPEIVMPETSSQGLRLPFFVVSA